MKRQPGDLQTFPVSAGLLDPRHVRTIGRAVWVYLWFLNRVTRDEQRGADEFVGIVLNGRSVSIDEIAGELGIDYRTCRRHLARLVDAEYVLQKKTGAGTCTYAVTKSKRWAWKRRGPTGTKMASGSPDPQTQIWPVGPDPETTFDLSTGQKRPEQKDGSRARSQETTKTLTHTVAASEVPALEDWVTKVAAEHPALAHLKGRRLSQAQEFAIAEAISRDGHELVIEGTCHLRDAVAQWPKDERRYIPNPVRFYQQSEYLKDRGAWERGSDKKTLSGYVPLPSDYVPASEQIRRERAAAGAGR